jgi:hypothetical protein
MDGMMSCLDSEELYLSVLIHRLRAASIMGTESISLYELLGTTTVIEDQPDVMVDTSGAWALGNTHHNDFACVCSDKINTPTVALDDASIRYTKMFCVFIYVINCLSHLG